MDSSRASSRRTSVPTWVVLVSVVLTASASTWGINRRSTWLDEAVSRAATTQLAETIGRTGGTMAAYYALLDGWTGLFGDSIVAMRMLSVVFVAVTVVVISKIAARVLEPGEAILATVLVALLPGIARYGQEARSYALTAMVASLSWLALIGAVQRSNQQGERRRATTLWAMVAALSAFGVLAHGLFILQVAAQGLSLLVGRRKEDLYRFAPAALVGLLTAAYLFSTGADSVATWVPPVSKQQVFDVGELLLGPSMVLALALLALVVLGAVTAVRGAVSTTNSEDRWLALVPLFWAIAPLLLLAALSSYRPYFLARYLVASLPAIALLFAIGIRGLVEWKTTSAKQMSARRLTGAAAGVCIGLLLIGQVLMRQDSGDDWRGTARVLATSAETTDAVLFTQPDLKLPMDTAWSELDQHGLVAPKVIYPAYPLGVLHRFPDGIPLEQLTQSIRSTPRLWIVHSTFVHSKDELLDEVLDLPAVADGFDVTKRWHFDGDIQLLLLERTPL